MRSALFSFLLSITGISIVGMMGSCMDGMM